MERLLRSHQGLGQRKQLSLFSSKFLLTGTCSTEPKVYGPSRPRKQIKSHFKVYCPGNNRPVILLRQSTLDPNCWSTFLCTLRDRQSLPRTSKYSGRSACTFQRDAADQ